ncbi:MAG: hypothetical protein U5Q44_12700 [Dehalococcoidia bacterium]|nr:hypothetical protein [Dehalococcoidia bacterium]
MSDVPFIPSRNFPRDIFELSQWQWNPRIKFARERVQVDIQRVLRPDVEVRAFDPQRGQNVDTEA